LFLSLVLLFFFKPSSTTDFYTLSLHDALPICVPDNLADPLEIAWILAWGAHGIVHHPLHLFNGNIFFPNRYTLAFTESMLGLSRSEEHTSELQSLAYLVCRLLLEKKKTKKKNI